MIAYLRLVFDEISDFKMSRRMALRCHLLKHTLAAPKMGIAQDSEMYASQQASYVSSQWVYLTSFYLLALARQIFLNGDGRPSTSLDPFSLGSLQV